MRAGAGALDAFETGALRPILAIRHPREEQEAAAHDHDRCAKPHPVPDPFEEQDPEHPEKQDRDRCFGLLEVQPHRRRVYEEGGTGCKRW